MGIVQRLNLKGNPFEHYTAETEPDISAYAVRPPYLNAIADRARGLSSFILFGDRGAGKSATRITVYNEIWAEISAGSGTSYPFVVNLTDYNAVISKFQKGTLADKDLVALAAFYVLEQLLVWLASLEEDDRATLIGRLTASQRTLAHALFRGFYLSVNQVDREHSTGEVFRLLQSAWTTKSAAWATNRWDAISQAVSTALGIFVRQKVDEALDVSDAAERLLASLVGDAASAPRVMLSKLAELIRAFGFSGVCVLVDKVDETQATTNSAESTARLVHPVLSHIQLLEVSGFSWVFFLWANVAGHFNSGVSVRLDKIAHTDVEWRKEELREMVDARVRFYSDDRLDFAGLIDSGLVADEVFASVVSLANESPRELIKILDTIVREHDARGASGLIDSRSLELGQDKYASGTINSSFADRHLEQVLRLGMTAFSNKDVQTTFRISDQGARTRIRTWADGGLVKQDGEMPSDAGGKPVYRYIIADPRLERIVERRLDERVGMEAEIEAE